MRESRNGQSKWMWTLRRTSRREPREQYSVRKRIWSHFSDVLLGSEELKHNPTSRAMFSCCKSRTYSCATRKTIKWFSLSRALLVPIPKLPSTLALLTVIISTHAIATFSTLLSTFASTSNPNMCLQQNYIQLSPQTTPCRHRTAAWTCTYTTFRKKRHKIKGISSLTWRISDTMCFVNSILFTSDTFRSPTWTPCHTKNYVNQFFQTTLNWPKCHMEVVIFRESLMAS